MMIQRTIPTLTLLSLLPLSYFTLANWNASLTQFFSWSSLVSITSYPFNDTLKLLDISNHMLSRPNQFYYNYLYRYLNTLYSLNTLSIKKLGLQKPFSFQSRTQSTTTQFLMQDMHSFLKTGRCSFICYHLIHRTTPTIPTNNPVLYIIQFLPPNIYVSPPCLLVHLTFPTVPTNAPFL